MPGVFKLVVHLTFFCTHIAYTLIVWWYNAIDVPKSGYICYIFCQFGDFHYYMHYELIHIVILQSPHDFMWKRIGLYFIIKLTLLIIYDISAYNLRATSWIGLWIWSCTEGDELYNTLYIYIICKLSNILFDVLPCWACYMSF